jgi:hypothetical protein
MRQPLPVLIGVLDLVRCGRIVDFKSTGKTPDNDVALHQNGLHLDCDSILYRESTGKREAGRELHHLVKTKVPKVIVTETGPSFVHSRVESWFPRRTRKRTRPVFESENETSRRLPCRFQNLFICGLLTAAIIFFVNRPIAITQ